MSEAEQKSIEGLVAAAKRGDREAQNELFVHHLPGMQAFVRLRASDMLLERESACDLVQSACRMALKNLDQFEFRGETSFRNWLLTYAVNTMRNKERFVRADRRSPMNERDVESMSGIYRTFCTPSVNVSAREQIELIESLFDELPPDYREVIVLAKVQNLSHHEIASQMEKTEGAARVLLSRALVRLSVLLAEREARDGSVPEPRAD